MMGKNIKDYELNRMKKIERNKKRRFRKKRNIFSEYQCERNVFLRKSQKTFDKNNFYVSVKSIYNLVSLDVPECFDLIENADQSFAFLKKLNYIFMKSKASNLFLDYSKCKKLGLEASVLTDVIVLNGFKYRKMLKKQIRISGNVPASYNARELFWNSGLLKHLNLSKVEDPQVDRLDSFNMPSDDAFVTSKTLEYVQKCLNRTGYELNGDGISYFTNLIGEIVGNEKNHSGDNGEWYVSGHFTQATKDGYGMGRLSFISIGNTIYEKLKYNCKSEETKNKIELHLKNQKKFFDLSYNEESSVTVFGLQYRISSETDEDNVDRGTGTLKFIDSFSKLGQTINNEKPKMAIISGNTHILFDGTYNLQEKGPNKVKVIAFNKENDINKKPDSNFVKVLKNRFPGVIISIEFYLDKKYLDRFKEED